MITAEDEAVRLLSELLRIDTTNSSSPERPAAEWVASKLDEVGVSATILEPSPGRASVVAKIAGNDSRRPALLVHGHLDVVPADPSDWSVDPFGGEIRDGFVWGRGAVDMKNLIAMVIAIVRGWVRAGRKPTRDLVLAFVADEESGGKFGSLYLANHHPELFERCSEAIGEVGGFSVSLGCSGRIYAVQVAEKGFDWLLLRAKGRQGHSSMIHDDNAITRLADIVSRIGNHRFPDHIGDDARLLVSSVSDVAGMELDPRDTESWPPNLAAVRSLFESSIRSTANPTTFKAGKQSNVVPGTAEAMVDVRFLPGDEQAVLAGLDELIGEAVDRECLVRADAVETSFNVPLVARMSSALRAEDPGCRVVPYLSSAGTDAKAFSKLGIRCFGFVPLRLPPNLDFMSLFHNVDERVPVDGLRFGVRVLDRVLRAS